MNYQRIVLRTTLCLKYSFYRVNIICIGCQSVNGFGRDRNNSAVFKYFGCAVDINFIALNIRNIKSFCDQFKPASDK